MQQDFVSDLYLCKCISNYLNELQTLTTNVILLLKHNKVDWGKYIGGDICTL